MTNASVTPGVNTMLLSKEHLDAMGRTRWQSPTLRKTKAKKPKWYISYYKDVRLANGEKKRPLVRKYFGFVHNTSAKVAKELHAAFLAKLNAGEFGIVAQCTVGEWIDAGFRDLHYPTLKASSQALYEKHLKNHVIPVVGGVPFGEINKLTVQRFANYLVGKGLASETRKVIMGVFKAVINSARDAEIYTGPDLFRKVAMGPERHSWEQRILDVEDLRRLIAATSGECRAAILLASATGMRSCEMWGLQWGDIDRQKQVIYVSRRKYDGVVDSPKSRKGRRVVPLAGLEATLDALPRVSEWVFVRSPHTLKEQLVVAAKRLGIYFKGFGWHSFRRAYASALNEAQVDMRVIQRVMGHATAQMTREYIIRDAEVSRAKEIVQ